MLETDEVDDDYFTPVASTSLANIFGNTSENGEKVDNESLKYTPPKQQTAAQNPEDSKSTECIYACAIIGYEWFNNVYTPKGKLGFAILKMSTTGIHNIVLYDSNKATLSCTTISLKLEVSINDNHICYYDNVHKYWSLYATEKEIKNIIDILNNIGISIKNSSHSDNELPEPSKSHSKMLPHEECNKKYIGNDTDSVNNKKTKMSILNRMANMGHSVLPSHTNVIERTSDSSDTNDSNNLSKIVRPKPVRSFIKRMHQEKSIVLSEPQNVIETQQKVNEQAMDSNFLYTYINGILVPVKNTNIITSSSGKSSNDMDFFISEQRVNNSEVRININRITDKVDNIIDKINNLEQKDNNPANMQTEILQKLLREYENKINLYEDLLKRGSNDVNQLNKNEVKTTVRDNENEMHVLNNKIAELEQITVDKNYEISKLNKQLQILHTKLNEHTDARLKDENEFHKKMITLQQALSNKNEELINVTEKYETLSVIKDQAEIGDKIKNIMNDTYQTLAENFENNDEYSGESIKKIIAVVIKKVTIDAIREIK